MDETPVFMDMLPNKPDWCKG